MAKKKSSYKAFYALIIIVFVFLIWFFFSKQKIIEYLDNQIIYSAIIIEPRQHPAFDLVLNNFLTYLDNRWEFVIFHGNQNKDFLQTLITDKFAEHNHRIKLVHMNVDNINIYDYSRLMRSKKLYNYISSEMFLVFQLDTLISNKYHDKIYDFMQYDYVGAPWPHRPYSLEIGNGGLSLRRKSKMLEVIDNFWMSYDEPEDIYFSSYEKLLKPSYEEAMHFSVECEFFDKSFAIHKPWLCLSHDQMQTISEHIPDLFKLAELYTTYSGQSAPGNFPHDDIGIIFDK